MPLFSSQSPQVVQDIAIVGAGVSGLYSAWRLQQDGDTHGRRVVLFEGSHRIGGRLLSVTPPGMPDARVELGGMRFPTSHRIVHALVAHLGLLTRPFEVDQDSNIAFLRGQTLRMADLTDPDKLPYELSATERASVKSGIIAMVARHCLSAVLNKADIDLSHVAWEDLARSGRYGDCLLRDVTMSQVFDDIVSPEAHQFAQDASGYDSIFSTWNAADGFPWKLSGYGKSVDYRCLAQGYESLPQAMLQKFKAGGGTVKMGHRLVSFDQVTLDDGAQAIELKFCVGGQATTVLTRQLVLALPRRSLELLEPTGAMLGPTQVGVRRLIESVQPVPLYKLALCYRQRWWEKLGITQGRSITDLPIRQCYYLAGGDGSDAGFIIIYNDGQDKGALAPLRGDPQAYPSPLGHDVPTHAHDECEHDALQAWCDHPAPASLVKEAHRQLLAMHGLEDHPDLMPYAAAYRDWQTDPYGGGANFWPRHVDSHQVARQIIQPLIDLPIYICGEAYSHAQGWVEGALATAEHMLQRHLGLKPPSYLAPAV